MVQPPEYEIQGEPSRVYRLKKAIYGLKQSPRAWFEKFCTIVAQHGLKRCISDHLLYVYYSFACGIVSTVYMNNVIISGDDLHRITTLKEYLSTHFHMKDLDNIHYILRYRVSRSQ